MNLLTIHTSIEQIEFHFLLPLHDTSHFPILFDGADNKYNREEHSEITATNQSLESQASSHCSAY